jgi:hypothetical protein
MKSERPLEFLKLLTFWTLTIILFLFKYMFRKLDCASFLKSFIKFILLIALIYYRHRILDLLNSSLVEKDEKTR